MNVDSLINRLQELKGKLIEWGKDPNEYNVGLYNSYFDKEYDIWDVGFISNASAISSFENEYLKIVIHMPDYLIPDSSW